MLLALNIGNSEISFGFMDGGELVSTAALKSDAGRTADEYACLMNSLFALRGITPDSIDGAICASVVPSLTERIRTAVTLLCGRRVHLLGAGIKTGLNILTDDPSELGGDLVAAAIGALTKYKPPLILIDLGTAVTFSDINRDGAYIGCAIAPGIALSAEALADGASLLPHVAAAVPKKSIGTSTIMSMQSGTVYGSVAMIDGMSARMEAELGESATLIASGGNAADILIPLCSREIIRDDTLIFRGLAEIYRKNQRKK